MYMPQKPIFHSITVRDYIRDGDFEINDRSISQVIKILDISKTFNTPSKIFRFNYWPRWFYQVVDKQILCLNIM